MERSSRPKQSSPSILIVIAMAIFAQNNLLYVTRTIEGIFALGRLKHNFIANNRIDRLIISTYPSIAILYNAFTVFQLRVVTGMPNLRSKKLFESLVFPYPFGQNR
jgi:hypothetical protein